MKCIFLLSFIILTLFLGACSTPARQYPRLDAYPRAQIDRPYTLPETLRSWEPSFGAESTRDNVTGTSGSQAWVNPFYFRTSINDTWTLLWDILPLGAQHQLIDNSDTLLGFSFGISGFSYSTVSGFEVRPFISVFDRLKINKSLAFDSDLEYTAVLNGNYSGYALNLNTGPLFQVSETFAISPRIILSEQSGYSFYSESQSPLIYQAGPNFLVPIGLRAMWSLSRHWDLNGEYRYTAIGARNGWVDNLFFGNLAYTWSL